MFGTLRKSATALVVAALFGAGASVAYADNVTYEPKTKTMAGTLPFAGNYTVIVKSPGKLTKEGEGALANGITANVRISAADWPEGSSEAAAEAMVSVSASQLMFFSLSDGQPIIVSVSAAAGTIPGDYTFTIQADGPSQHGWGNASHTLTVTAAPALVAADTTPPNVTITSPAAGQAFVFCSAGTAIPVAVDANDAESAVSLVAASGNGAAVGLSAFTPGHNVSVNGIHTANDIGTQAASAWATSQGGTSAPVQQAFSVNYTLAFLPPLSLGKTGKGGSTMPIKFTARDCNGQFVADTRVNVQVFEGATLTFSATFGEGSDSVRIDPIAAQYITNFTTAAGAHTYTVKVLFNGSLQGTMQFAVR